MATDYDIVLKSLGDWKDKAIDNYDQEYVKAQILVAGMVDALGSDYVSLSQWLASLETHPQMRDHFSDRWTEELLFIKEELLQRIRRFAEQQT